MKTKLLTKVISLLTFVLLTTTLKTQVTIGSGQASCEGTLLDLKEKPDGSSTRGMMLPRVKLKEINKLYPMLPDNYDPLEEDKHVGLVVFNTSEENVDFCKGIYIWNGAEWMRVPHPCEKAYFDTDNLLFYKSALAAKSVNLDMGYDGASVTWTNDGVVLVGEWQQYPLDITRKVTKTFNFQPKENNTGADRTTTVTATIKFKEKTYTYPITIKQLDREMLYALTPTMFGAKQNTYSATVNTEASDWDVSSLTTAVATSAVKSSNNTIDLALTNNPIWDRRTIQLDVTSTDPDFKARQVSVLQDAAMPYFKLTTPGTISLTAAQNVVFETNANWKFSSIAGNYAAVVGSASVVASTEQSCGTTPVMSVDKNVIFNPSTNNDPVAGNYSTTVRFTTANTGIRTAVTFDVIMNRTVPARLDFVSINPTNNGTIARYQGKTIATYKSNAKWEAVPNAGTTQTRSAAGYAQNALTVTFNDNATWNNRPVNLVIKNAANATLTTYNYTQSAYDLNYASHTFPATIPVAGATGALRFKTTNGSPASTYKARATGITDVTAAIPASNTANTAIQGATSQLAAMPNNPTGWTDRIVYFDLIRGASGATTTNALQLTQKAFTLTGSNNNIPGTIPRTGGSYRINTATSTATPKFRVKVTADGVGDLWTSGYSVVGLREAYIPAASITDRTIRVYIAREHKAAAGSPEWVQVYAATQIGEMIKAGNIYIDRENYGPTDYYIAKADCESRGAYIPTDNLIAKNRQALNNLGQGFWTQIPTGTYYWTATQHNIWGPSHGYQYLYNWDYFWPVQEPEGWAKAPKKYTTIYYKCVR